jgi:hypothetical protein
MSVNAKERKTKKKTKRAARPKRDQSSQKKKPEAANPVVGKRAYAKSLKIEEALRQEGIDESKIAQGYASLHEKLGDSADKGDLKLFFDVLKENSRVLEPPRPADRGGASENVTVVLRHNVPRPAR